MTVITDVPVLPSLVAVIVVVPTTSPVTSPAPDTLPAAGVPDVQDIARPVRTLLFASRVTAESCTVDPTVTEVLDGVTETVATGTGAGALTVITDVPLLPSLNAVIVALPAETAVTRPDPDTVAIAVLVELHVTTRPVSTTLFASRVTAESCDVDPTVIDVLDGLTETVATGTGAGALTVMADVPLFPSLSAVIVALPGETAVTRPEPDTVAMPLLLELHETTRPVSTTLFASRVTADS